MGQSWSFLAQLFPDVTFPSLDIVCPLVPLIARCLKLKGWRKINAADLELCFKKCQNLSTLPHLTVYKKRRTNRKQKKKQKE